MNIQPNVNSVTMCGNPIKSGKPSSWNRFKQAVLDALPSATFEDKLAIEKWKKFDDRLSKPAENRLIMGATAILTQPTIDYYNHNVDKETREISRNRTIAKIIAGTGVGILVRGSAYKLVENMTDIEGNKKHSKSLLPEKYITDLINKPKFLKNYRSALSTSIAIMAMCFTNFLIDAPLTVYLTNKFNANMEAKKQKSSLQKEVVNV